MDGALSGPGAAPRLALDRVRAALVAAVADVPGRIPPLGAYRLRPAQEESFHRVRDALAAYGGAVLADAPGTGKTIVALAVAAARPPGQGAVIVVAPAVLRGSWRRTALAAGIPIRFVSLEALSRGADPGSDPGAAGLVIVDEAHHLRTPSTRRYAAAARLCASAPTLLLSATPVVNAPRDLEALLALFLGSRASDLSPTARDALVVSRGREAAHRPRRVRLAALRGRPDVPGLAAALLALPPPVAARDGAQAVVLVRLSLALAWTSGLAALDAALRRRVLLASAFRDALAAGGRPSRGLLRAWTLGEDGMQLALGGVLASPSPAGPDDGVTRVELEEAITRHEEAVRALRARIAPHVVADTDARASALRALLARPNVAPIVCFARHVATVRALVAAFRAERGVVGLCGDRVWAPGGGWRRADVLAALAAPGGDAGGIRLLLATDLLAEGVDLAGARTVVHLDLPWTAARLTQRLGRLTRGEDPGAVVRETRFLAPRDLAPLLRIPPVIRRKRRALRRALDGPRARRLLRALLTPGAPLREPPDAARGSAPRGPALAAVAAPVEAFLASVSRCGPEGPVSRLIGGVRLGGRWRLSSRATRSIRLARLLADATPIVVSHDAARTAIRRIRRVCERRAAREASGLGGEASAARVAPARLPARAARTLRRWLEAAPTADQRRIAALDRALRAALDRGMPLARERALAALLRDPDQPARVLPQLERLLHATAVPRAAPAADEAPLGSFDAPPGRGACGVTPGAVSVRALLLFSPSPTPRAAAPPAPARRAASP